MSDPIRVSFGQFRIAVDENSATVKVVETLQRGERFATDNVHFYPLAVAAAVEVDRLREALAIANDNTNGLFGECKARSGTIHRLEAEVESLKVQLVAEANAKGEARTEVERMRERIRVLEAANVAAPRPILPGPVLMTAAEKARARGDEFEAHDFEMAAVPYVALVGDPWPSCIVLKPVGQGA